MIYILLIHKKEQGTFIHYLENMYISSEIPPVV